MSLQVDYQPLSQLDGKLSSIQISTAKELFFTERVKKQMVLLLQQVPQ